MTLDRDGRLLFATRAVRMFGYGLASVVLVLYLAALGLPDLAIGALLTLTLLGDAAISLWLTTHADRVGRRRVLFAGALLMCLAGVGFASTSALPVLVLAATIGVISPSGNEVGPFLAVEQASLSQTIADRARTRVFAWFNLTGSFATATGALVGGGLAGALIAAGRSPIDAYRVVIVVYACLGLVLAALFRRVSSRVEVARPSDVSVARRLGLHRSRGIVARLSALFALDAFAGGLIVQSLVAYWFHLRFGADVAVLGGVFFGANILAGISALAAAQIADRIGLVRTMVFTHLPSNVLLAAVPLMPTLPLAIIVLLARFSISQMDVPTRQSYTMAVVDPDERSAAAGVTGIARSLGASVSPLIAAPLFGVASLAALPFVLAGGLKIGYDVLLYRGFRSLRPAHELLDSTTRNP
ncbi:MAG: MFS transporter [Candidatus Limnocylindrales bacterium]|jgi:MFS family permease